MTNTVTLSIDVYPDDLEWFRNLRWNSAGERKIGRDIFRSMRRAWEAEQEACTEAASRVRRPKRKRGE